MIEREKISSHMIRLKKSDQVAVKESLIPSTGVLTELCVYLPTGIGNSGVWSPHVVWMYHLCFPLALIGVTYAKEEKNRLHLWLVTTVLFTLVQASLESGRLYHLLQQLDSMHRTSSDALHLHNMELQTGLLSGTKFSTRKPCQ